MAENVSDAFRSLPMEALIGQPFKAACESNKLLADSMYDYIMRVAYTDGKLGKDNTRLLEFTLDQPTTSKEGVVTTIPIEVKAPFLGLTPIPSLLIDDVTVDFTMSVKSTEQDTDTSSVTSSTSGRMWGFSMSCEVTASQERIRSSDQSATYTVHVGARQQPQTEGLSRLMDVMANCIAPISGGG